MLWKGRSHHCASKVERRLGPDSVDNVHPEICLQPSLKTQIWPYLCCGTSEMYQRQIQLSTHNYRGKSTHIVCIKTSAGKKVELEVEKKLRVSTLYRVCSVTFAYIGTVVWVPSKHWEGAEVCSSYEYWTCPDALWYIYSLFHLTLYTSICMLYPSLWLPKAQFYKSGHLKFFHSKVGSCILDFSLYFLELGSFVTTTWTDRWYCSHHCVMHPILFLPYNFHIPLHYRESL